MIEEHFELSDAPEGMGIDGGIERVAGCKPQQDKGQSHRPGNRLEFHRLTEKGQTINIPLPMGEGTKESGASAYSSKLNRYPVQPTRKQVPTEAPKSPFEATLELGSGAPDLDRTGGARRILSAHPSCDAAQCEHADEGHFDLRDC